ncbi:MAG TPA: TonB-dependent receptor [Pyrinomonadaceae bacterium]|nr:TonB-dependent receptor [Pyrinomonadaceae bacterium]
MTTTTPPAAKFCVLIVIILSLTVAAFGQSQATTGNIEGRVLDPKEAAVPGASVTATNQATGLERTATTDDQGIFQIILLPPGVYTVRATASGFATTEAKEVTVTVGSRTPLDLAVTVGGTSGSVTITSEAPVVETSRTSVATTINQRSIDNLPINGRNFQDFATLSPAVIRDPRGGDLSVGGQRGTFNSLQVDGVDNNNTFFGQALGRGGVRPPYQFSEESVQEFQVNQNGFSAEFGRAAGGLINVVTKSGTNDFHGGVFEYLRDESLNANDPITKAQQFRAGLPNKRSPLRIHQFGGRLGGPIAKNRAFFFFTYDGQRADVPQLLTVNLATVPASVRTVLEPKIATYQVGRTQDVFLGKADIKLNDSNQLSLRYNHQGFTGNNNENNGPFSAEEHSGDSLVKSDTFSGNLTSTLSQRVVNEFRFQFARDKEPGQANSDQPEAIITIVTGTNLSIGRNNFSPRETTIKRKQFIDNLSYLSGRSNWKFGVDFNFDHIFNFFPGLFSGAYTFPSAVSFRDNTPSAYTQNFPGAGTTGGTTEPNLSEYGFYGQNDFRVTPQLTLNLGLRYDYQGLACPPIQNTDPLLLSNNVDTSVCPKDKNNFAPRTGFSYSPSEKTVVRGGFGIYYGRTPAIVLGTVHSQNGINVTGINLNAAGIAAAGLTYPNILTAPPPGASSNPNLFVFAKDYESPYVEQGRVGIEHEVARNLSVSATYLYYHGLHLTRTRDINLAAPVPLTISSGGQAYTFQRFPSARPISRATGQSYNRISLFESASKSLYHGLAIQATQRLTRGFQFIAAYTYSKAKDDRPDQTIVVFGADDAKMVENQINPALDYGRSDTDLRHRFVFSPVYEWGKIGWSDNPVARALFSDYGFSTIAQFQSGTPYSALVSNDPNNDGNRSNDRLPGTVRNQFTTPAIYQFDMRLTRSIPIREAMRIRLILEAFNVFNHPSVATVNTTFFAFSTVAGVPTLTPPNFLTAFGTPRSFSSPASGTTTFVTPRQLQLAIKFDF